MSWWWPAIAGGLGGGIAGFAAAVGHRRRLRLRLRGGNTHYAVIEFSGDPAGEHPDPELCGSAPALTLIAAGPEEFCWDALVEWTAAHPLRMWETAEVLARHPSVVRDPQEWSG